MWYFYVNDINDTNAVIYSTMIALQLRVRKKVQYGESEL